MNNLTNPSKLNLFISNLVSIGDKATDTETEKIQHHLLMYMGTLMGFSGLLWGFMSLYFELYFPASIPFGYSVLTVINFYIFYLTKNFERARFIQVLLSLLLPFMFQWVLGGFVSSGAMMLWSMIALLGSMTFNELKLGVRWLGVYLLLTIFSGFVDGYAATTFGLNLSPSSTTALYVLNITFISAIVFGLGLYLFDLLRSTQKGSENLVVELNSLLGTIEKRVTDRTHDLATVAELGTTIATISNSKQLLQTVVNLTKERFNLYHAQIYLLDESGEKLVLSAGAGEAGKQMLANDFSIPLNHKHSLVANAAREQKGFAVNDVTQTPDFLPNSLLPNTRSELAVPILVSNKVLGVIDIQSEQLGRFNETDINIQTTLAAQLGVSIQNLRSFESTKHQADYEAQVNQISQKIQSATTVEAVLQIAARELGQALGAQMTVAQLGLDSNRNLQLGNQ